MLVDFKTAIMDFRDIAGMVEMLGVVAEIEDVAVLDQGVPEVPDDPVRLRDQLLLSEEVGPGRK